MSNKVASQLEISIVSIYIKNCNNINANDIQNAHLPQYKSYLKILGISYVMEDTNMPINFNIIELFIKTSHIFNNINIASRPHVVKISSKSNIAIVWIDIWSSQNSSMAKRLINWYFNVGRFITAIRC